MTWISNFPGEASPLTPLVCSCFTVQFIQSRAANKITDKLPVHSFVYNLTILMRKQKLTKDVEMMSENWEVRLDLIWQKTSWLNPCKSAANLFIGPTLPTAAACCRLLPPAAACCRLQCYDFGVRKKLFSKKARVCTCHAYSEVVAPNLINFIISCQIYHNLLFLFHVVKSFYTVTRFIVVLLKPICCFLNDR